MCLVSISGAPDLTQVGPDLSAVSNANCDLFTAMSTNTWYLLASGRWFTTSDLLNGPWTSIRSDALPKDFAAIDPHGPWGNVLACVAGTTQATTALYQASVPHTATLDRSLAKPNMQVLGQQVQFAPIQGRSCSTRPTRPRR